ncbi:MAG: energy transducer TonB [Acidobacteriota bacterium]
MGENNGDRGPGTGNRNAGVGNHAVAFVGLGLAAALACTTTTDRAVPGSEPARLELAEPTTVRAGATIERPRAIVTPGPDWAKLVGIRTRAGKVVLKLLVNRDGSVGEVRVVRSTDPALDAACREAASRWRFEPAKVNGEPVAAWDTVTIAFSPRES